MRKVEKLVKYLVVEKLIKLTVQFLIRTDKTGIEHINVLLSKKIKEHFEA